MASYSFSIGGTVPAICWIKPAAWDEYEVFCNSPHGYDIVAFADDGSERVVSSGSEPVKQTISLQLREDEKTLTIRAR